MYRHNASINLESAGEILHSILVHFVHICLKLIFNSEIATA